MKTWSLIKRCVKCTVEYVGPKCTNKNCPHVFSPADIAYFARRTR